MIFVDAISYFSVIFQFKICKQEIINKEEIFEWESKIPFLKIPCKHKTVIRKSSNSLPHISLLYISFCHNSFTTALAYFTSYPLTIGCNLCTFLCIFAINVQAYIRTQTHKQGQSQINIVSSMIYFHLLLFWFWYLLTFYKYRSLFGIYPKFS